MQGSEASDTQSPSPITWLLLPTYVKVILATAIGVPVSACMYLYMEVIYHRLTGNARPTTGLVWFTGHL